MSDIEEENSDSDYASDLSEDEPTEILRWCRFNYNSMCIVESYMGIENSSTIFCDYFWWREADDDDEDISYIFKSAHYYMDPQIYARDFGKSCSRCEKELYLFFLPGTCVRCDMTS